MKRVARIEAAAGPLAEFSVGLRVNTREGYVGTITDIHEGPADLTTYWVTLDNGMGGGEYAEGEIWPAGTSSTAAVERTAAEDYPELGEILETRLPPQIVSTAAGDRFDAFLSWYEQIEGASDIDITVLKDAFDRGVTPEEFNQQTKKQAGVEVPGTCTTCGKKIKVEKGVLTHADGSNEHQVQPSDDAQAPIGIASSKTAQARRDVWKAPSFDFDDEDPAEPPAQLLRDVVGYYLSLRLYNEFGVAADYETGRILEVRSLPNGSVEVEWDPEGFADSYPMAATSIHTVTRLEEPAPQAERLFASKMDLSRAAEHLAITLDLKPLERDEAETDDPEEKKGYEDGIADGKAGVTRNFQDDSPGYRAGYDRGWARGVEIGRSPAPMESDWDDSLENAQIAGTDPHLGAHEAGIFTDILTGNDSNPKYDGYKSYDWCRYRRDQHCFYSKNLNVAASEQAGYAIWIPENRGTCWRGHWDAQQACEMAMPGPRVPGGFTDATVPWEQGGQRGGRPSGTYRRDPSIPTHAPPPYPPPGYRASLDPVLAWHMTAAWRDIQTKAKRIRSEGGVRIVASKDGTVVGHVRGDTNVYETELVAVPGRRQVAQWHCGCKWSAYSWGRSGPWKRFEGRMCSHALALQYEAQARGMFGRDLTLDEKQPSWMDPTLPVRRPGDYDRDKGRYSSLRPVEAQTDDEQPLKAMVASLLAEGTRYADVREFALAFGVQDVPALVREARRTPSFPAKVRGLIRRLFIENGSVFDEQTKQEVAARDVLFPNWDPRKGLNYRPPRQAAQGGCACGSGSCGCGSVQHVASPADELGRARTPDQAVDALLAIARRMEPGVTREMQSLAQRYGGRMSGLEFRLKSKSSMLGKIQREMHKFPSLAAAALGSRDPLRYTMLFPPETYTESSKRIIETLKSQGYRTVVANYWQRSDPYNGINVALTTRDGFPVELQFHTDETIRVKEEQVHPVYDKWKNEPDPFKREKYSAQMRDMFDMVHRPPGALSVGELRKRPILPWNKVDWLHGRVLTGAVGQPGPYRFLLVEDSGTLIRVDTDDSTVEEWAGDDWVVNLDLGRYIFMGEPGSEEIDEQDANLVISGWGMEPSYNFSGDFEWAKGPNSIDTPATFPRAAALDDPPEPALPVAYGDDDEVADLVARQFALENPPTKDGCAICGDSGHNTNEHVPSIHDDINRAARLLEAAVVDDAIEMINEAYAAGEVDESSVTWYAPDAAGQSHAQADLGKDGVESRHRFAGLDEDEWLLDHETAGQATAAFYTEQEMREVAHQEMAERGMSAEDLLAEHVAWQESVAPGGMSAEGAGVAACPRCGNPVNDGSDLVMVAGEGLVHKSCPTPGEAKGEEKPEKPGEEPVPEETEQQKASRLMEQFKASQRDPSIPNPFEQHESKAAGDAEIQQAAKMALKSFTPAEQQQYIAEGEEEGVTASNLDRLDISGTHYEALALTQAQAEEIEKGLQDWGDGTIQ